MTESNITQNCKVLLLCHGRKHERYSHYYERALHIDISRKTRPDIIFDLHFGLPRFISNIKFKIIQAVYWPQIHKKFASDSGRRFFRRTRSGIHHQDGSIVYNLKLIADISRQIETNGYFIFNHSGNTDILNQILNYYGFVKVQMEDIETDLKINIFPKVSIEESLFLDHYYLCYKKIN